jgi:hypothetical protein
VLAGSLILPGAVGVKGLASCGTDATPAGKQASEASGRVETFDPSWTAQVLLFLRRDRAASTKQPRREVMKMEAFQAHASWQDARTGAALVRQWLDDDCIGTQKPVLASTGLWTELTNVDRCQIYRDYLTWVSYVKPQAATPVFLTRAQNGKLVTVTEDATTVVMRYLTER